LLFDRIVWGSREADELARAFGASHWGSKNQVARDSSTATSSHTVERAPDGGVTVRPYELMTGKGFQIQATDEQSIFVERFDKVSAVTWPTQLNAESFMPLVEQILGLTSGSSTIRLYVGGESDAHEVSRDELSKQLNAYGKAVEVVRMDDDTTGISVVWQREIDDPDAYEGGLVAGDMPTDKLEQIFRETGTSPIETASGSLARLALDSIR
jgi:hypothetical protein